VCAGHHPFDRFDPNIRSFRKEEKNALTTVEQREVVPHPILRGAARALVSHRDGAGKLTNEFAEGSGRCVSAGAVRRYAYDPSMWGVTGCPLRRMRLAQLRAVPVIVLTSVVGSNARAGEPFEHDGFQFRGAIGAGYMSDSESASDGSFGATIAGAVPFTFEIYLGGALAPGLRLGGTLETAVLSGPTVSFHPVGPVLGDPPGALTMLGIGPYLDWYPDPRGGFHAMALALAVSETFTDGQAITSGASGFGVGGGIGYDWWAHRRWSVGILARFTYAWPTGSTQYGDLTGVDNRIVSSAILCSVAFH
jgi:hypothetical protein